MFLCLLPSASTVAADSQQVYAEMPASHHSGTVVPGECMEVTDHGNDISCNSEVSGKLAFSDLIKFVAMSPGITDRLAEYLPLRSISMVAPVSFEIKSVDIYLLLCSFLK